MGWAQKAGSRCDLLQRLRSSYSLLSSTKASVRSRRSASSECSIEQLGPKSGPTHRAQILAVPGRRNAFARRIRTGLIGARSNPLLAELADMPVLFIGHVPKVDRVVWVVGGVARRGRVRME